MPELNYLVSFVISALGGILIWQFKGMREDIREIGSSVKDLNEKIATIVTNQDWHKEEIRELKERMIRLENKEK
jgi:hypothetical protein